MKQTVSPDKIDWTLNDGKRDAQEFVFNALTAHLSVIARRRDDEPIRVLSMPGASWPWEISLSLALREYHFDFTGIERDKSVHAMACRAARILPPNFTMVGRPLKFQAFARSNELQLPDCARSANQQFDLIYLDWMGTWGREKKEDLGALFAHDILAPGGVLMTTIQLRRGQPDSLRELGRLVAPNTFDYRDARGLDTHENNPKVQGIPRWIDTIPYEEFGVRMKTVTALVYYSTTSTDYRPNPMLQLISKRVN